MNTYIPGEGNPNAKIVFVGEAPSYEEELKGSPFVGPAGRIFDEMLRNAGIHREECWVTNVFKYMIVPQNKTGKKIPAVKRAEQAGIDVAGSIDELRIELNQIKPNVIVPLGGTALWALFGKEDIKPYRGSILKSPTFGYKLVPSYHPAALLYSVDAGNYWWKPIIEFDFRRALKESHSPEIIRPYRYLHICKTSASLQDFYDRARKAALANPRKRIRLAVDIEALRCVPVCVSLAFNKIEGIVVPLWNDTTICKISNIPSGDLASIWNILDQILRDPIFEIVGQNFKYDQDKLYRLGFRTRLFSDTMLKSFAINPEFSTSLAFNTSIYTEEPYYKDEGLEFDYTKHPIDDLLYYGARDAPVTWEIDEAQEGDIKEYGLESFYYNYLMKLSDLYLNIENQGFEIIQENRERLLRKYIAWEEQLKYELFKLTGQHVNCQSPKQIEVLLYEVMKIPRRQGTGEEVLTQLLGNVVKKEEQRAVLTNILEQRRVHKTIGTYITALPDYDNRFKTSYYICLETGRTATGLLDPPLRPAFDKKKFTEAKGTHNKKSIGSAFQTITKHGDVGGDVRKMYGPHKGEVILNIDSSQAEARVIALLSDDETTLKMYDTNDVHALTASWFLGRDEAAWSKKTLGYECPERFLGKTLRHAGHLGAKGQRAATEVNTQARKYHIDISISVSFADKALKVFHQKSPKIQKVFHKLVIECLERNRRLIAPLPYGVDSPIGGHRIFYERWGDELFRQAFSYLPQRSVSDNTKAAALRIKKELPWLKILVESHDSLTVSLPYFLASEIGGFMKFEMERPIRFETCSIPRHDLIIPAELEIGENYKDLKKFKDVV